MTRAGIKGDAPLARRSIWIAQGITIAGLILYVLVVKLLAPALQGDGRPAPASIGLALALVPAVLWLILFYVQDAREPEPLAYVLRVAVAGGLLAGAVAIPALRKVYAAPGWLYAGPVVSFLASILVVGSLQEFCKYVAVRFTVFETEEFDEVADGVTYGTAAGLGLATMLNLWFVLESPAVNPVAAAIRIVITAMAHAAFGGVLGYFLGRAKIHQEYTRVVWGFLAAAVCNGLFSYALRQVTHTGFIYRPWHGLIFATAVAVLVTFVLLWLVRRQGASAAT